MNRKYKEQHLFEIEIFGAEMSVLYPLWMKRTSFHRRKILLTPDV